MVYDVEDEIDWSDGPIGPPTPGVMEVATYSGCAAPQPVDTESTDELFVPETGLFNEDLGDETTNQYEVLPGSPLPISTVGKTKFV